MVSIAVLEVVVGKAMVLASKLAPHAMVLVAVPVISTIRVSPWTGVPVRLDVMEVMLAASAVILNTSKLSVLIAGVAEEAVVPLRLVIRLLVNVSVEVLATKVSAPEGIVTVPPLEILAMTGVVSVLLVRVSVDVLATRVSAPEGMVTVPPLLIEAITGRVSVLLVSVSVVALPTRVSVLVGSVRVPELLIVDIIGAVSVLAVSVWVSDVPTNVPEGAVLADRDWRTEFTP